MIILAFDTETTGLPSAECKGKLRWPYKWDKISQYVRCLPYLVDIGIVILEMKDCKQLADLQLFISDSPPSAPGALAVHKLTGDFLEEHGVAVQDALAQVMAMIRKWKPVAVLGYNVRFDIKVLMAAAVRLNNRELFGFLQSAKQIDVMDLAMPIVNKRDPRNGRPLPSKLIECLKFFFPQSTFTNLHTALADIKATVAVFSEIQQRFPKFADIFSEAMAMSSEQRQLYSKFLLYNQDMLVDAAPGAGKTFLMINIIAALLKRSGKQRIHKDGICLLCYNRALADMYETEFKKFGLPKVQTKAAIFHMSTLDSLCRKLINRNVGLTNYCKLFMDNQRSRMPAKVSEKHLAGLRACKYVFVDEYQDLKEEHIFLLKFIAEAAPQARWFAAGDIRQTLYGEMGAQPMAVRALRNWRFETISSTYRCAGSVVDFCNAVFAQCDFSTPENTKWAAVESIFRLPLRTLDPEPVNVTYKMLLTGSLWASDELLAYVREKIANLRRAEPNHSIGILSPVIKSTRAKNMMMDIELCLSREFGPLAVFRRGQGGGRSVVISPKQHAVEIQSIHASKGLTIDHVFLINFFECQRGPGGAKGIDWSFQLHSVQSCIKLFVAASRAKRSLTLIDNRVAFTRCMRPVDDIKARLTPESDAPKLTDFDPVPPSIALFSVCDAVDKHLCAYGHSVDLLVDLQLSIERVSDEGYGTYRHPFTAFKDPALNQQLGNAMLIILYGQFLEIYVQRFFAFPETFPCFINRKESKFYNKNLTVSAAVKRRYENLTGRSFDAARPRPSVVMVPASSLAAQNSLFARYNRDRKRELTPAIAWNAARIQRYPSKALLPLFDFPSDQLTPIGPDFWTELPRTLEKTFKQFADAGYQHHWQEELRSMSARWGPLEINILGRPDIFWLSEDQTHAILLDFKCVRTEDRIQESNFSGWHQLFLYKKLLERQFPTVTRTDCFIFSFLTGCTYQCTYRPSKKRAHDDI